MTIAHQKQFFRSGDQIDVDTINRAEESCVEDNTRALDRRYFHSFYSCDLDGIAMNDPAASRTFYMDVDLEHTITGMEIFIDSASTSTTFTVELSSYEGTGFTTVSRTVTTASSGSSGTWAYADHNDLNVHVTANTAYRVRVSTGGSETITNGMVNIHYVCDRQTGNSQSEPGDPLTEQNLKSGDTMTAADFSTQNTDLAAAVTAEAARCYAPQIVVCKFDSPAAFPVHLMASQKCAWKIYHDLMATVGLTVTTTVKDENGATVGSASALVSNGTSNRVNGTLVSGGNDTQATHDPEDHNDAWTVNLSVSGSAANRHYYIVFVWI